MKKFKSMELFLLLIACVYAGVRLYPQTVDEVSEHLLQTSDTISVLVLYDSPVDEDEYSNFFDLFDDERAWYTQLPEEYIDDFTLINIDLSNDELAPIGDLFDIVSMPTMIVLDKGDMVISLPLDEDADHHVVTYVLHPDEYHDLINSAVFARDMEVVPRPHRQEMGDHEEDHSHINIDYDMTKSIDGDLSAQQGSSFGFGAQGNNQNGFNNQGNFGNQGMGSNQQQGMQNGMNQMQGGMNGGMNQGMNQGMNNMGGGMNNMQGGMNNMNGMQGGMNQGGFGGGGNGQDIDNPQVVAEANGQMGNAMAEANDNDAFANVQGQSGQADARVNGIGGSAMADTQGDQMMAQSMGSDGQESANTMISADEQQAMAQTSGNDGGVYGYDSNGNNQGFVGQNGMDQGGYGNQGGNQGQGFGNQGMNQGYGNQGMNQGYDNQGFGNQGGMNQGFGDQGGMNQGFGNQGGMNQGGWNNAFGGDDDDEDHGEDYW